MTDASPTGLTGPDSLARLAAESGWIRELARQLVRDPHAADDAAQDALAAVLAHRGPIASLRALLATALRRRVQERGREEGTRSARERHTARDEALPSTLDMLARASVQRDLVQAVLELDEPYRTAILWRFFEELPPREIARRAGVPVATVNTRLQRGLACLRARLAKEHGREAWVVALLPLAARSAELAPLTLAGALLVKTSTQLVLAATLVAGLALVAWRIGGTERRVAESAPLVAPAAAELDEPGDVARRTEPPAGERSALEVANAPAGAESPAAVGAPIATEPARRVNGLVLDELGRPLGGVALATEPPGAGRAAFASDARGAFVAELVAPARAIVSADARLATVLAGAPATTAESGAIVVLAPRIALAGHVVDERGAPLAGAELALALPRGFGTDFGLPLDGALTRTWSATSAADGAFALDDVPAVAGAVLTARLGGFEPLAHPLPVAGDLALELVLARRGAPDAVRGRVLFPDGGAAVGARVAYGLATTVADAAGEFELRPALLGDRRCGGGHQLRALDPGTLALLESEPIPAGARGVELRLPDALFERVRGRVVDSEGAGIPGIDVVAQRMALEYAFPDGGTRDQFAPRPPVTTDSSGVFEITRVPREGVELFASGDAILFASVQLTPEADPDAVEIRAERRIHLQVELDPPLERADGVQVLDGDGKRLTLRIMRGSTSQTSPQARLEEGRSHVLSLSERARWVVLMSGEVEVARLPLRPGGGVNVVRW